MSGKTSWKDVHGETIVDFENSAFEQNVLDYLVALAKKNGLNLSEDELLYSPVTIGFLSSGYYDPGVYSGPWEDSYPEEGDDERIMESVSISIECRDEYKEIHVEDKKIAEIIFTHYFEDVEAVELED